MKSGILSPERPGSYDMRIRSCNRARASCNLRKIWMRCLRGPTMRGPAS